MLYSKCMPGYDEHASKVYRGVLESPRDIIRQELVAEQLARSFPGDHSLRVLDVGCGQGSQAIRLARQGHQVVGLDPAPEMRKLFAESLAKEPPEVRELIEIVDGKGEDAPTLFGEGVFMVGLCHGVLAYMQEEAEQREFLQTITRTIARNGLVSLLTINADASPLYLAQQERWDEALAAFEQNGRVVRQGVTLSALSMRGLRRLTTSAGLIHMATYGIRLCTDNFINKAPDGDFQTIKEVEAKAATSRLKYAAPFIHSIHTRSAADLYNRVRPLGTGIDVIDDYHP